MVDLTIELFIPGLFGLPVLPLAARMQTPALDRLLGTARLVGKSSDSARTATNDFKGLIPALGLDVAFAKSWPTAPYCLSVDDPNWDGMGFWLQADPVHLRADRDQLRLFDSGVLGISPGEACQLVAELNVHFNADGILLHAPVPERWYLRAPGPVALRTRALRTVMGGATLADAMPDGGDARCWNALMNEAQMLLHQSPVNQARAEAGRAAINGLWLSGPGTYAPLGLASDLRLVIGDDPLVLGLARAGGVPTASMDDRALPELMAKIPEGRILLINLELVDALRRGDLPGWEAAVQQLDRRLAPVLAWVLDQPGGRTRPKWSVHLHDGSGARWIRKVGWMGRLGDWFGKRLGWRRTGGLAVARAAVHGR
ncbi:cofactor-independent phosphoglycerate mutase [Thiorhodovibrio winogradskyi]|uniref:Cofactor-independent phosphoglycerate mutase n=1 Tax=Thiorhodovibrio winogradskyi TaxID=77007 RepID=A0ABZ0SC46_9GAMM|nr:phosphoglycerate mutase [Thiorhodovibrio winogradskyi]